MYPHYFIPFKTQENFYIYDLINRNIEVCDELTYTLYLDLYRNDHKYIHKKAIFNNEKYENYSVEQLNKAISNINAHLNYIKKHS